MTTQTYKIAHIPVQGQDIIIVPLSSSFHAVPQNRKQKYWLALRGCAKQAGLAGQVCLVWNYGRRFYFMAPDPWYPFFSSIDMLYVEQRINRKLTCEGW